MGRALIALKPMNSDQYKLSQGSFSAGVKSGLHHSSEFVSQSIANLLDVVRNELAMDIVFISRPMLDYVVITNMSSDPTGPNFKELSIPLRESFCQRILDGRLPAVMPDVAALSSTHDIPNNSMRPGAYLSVPIELQNGKLYGLLCCLRNEAWPELGTIHYRRLEISARQIARLLEEAGEV